MIRRFLDAEGPLFGFLDKMGQLILLSLLWLLGCVPLITFCTSCAALYYAVTKSVRSGQGSAVKEFLKSYRANIIRGCILTLLFAAIGALLVMLSGFVQTGGVAVGMILLCFVLMYVGPVLSRFDISVWKVLELSFVMSLQYPHYTLVFLIGVFIIVFAQLFVLPIAMLLILPGVYCRLICPLMEKVLHRYMPVDSEEGEWYNEN